METRLFWAQRTKRPRRQLLTTAFPSRFASSAGAGYGTEAELVMGNSGV